MTQLITIAAARERRLVERSEQAAHIPFDSADRSALAALPAKQAAAFLAPYSWHERAAFFDNLVGECLVWMTDELARLDLHDAEARWFLRREIGEVRKKVTDILDLLALLAPLAADGDAMRVYRVSDDPGRLAQARRHRDGGAAEGRGMALGSNLMILRNSAMRLDLLRDEDERARAERDAP